MCLDVLQLEATGLYQLGGWEFDSPLVAKIRR